MGERWAEERTRVLTAAREMATRGLVSGTAGNVSARLEQKGGPDLYLVTPAAMPYERMTADDLVVVDQEIEPVDSEGIPSTESMLHLAIYRARPEVKAVMHTHSVYATVAAVTGRPIPPIVDELVINIGGPVEVADYGAPASEELAEAAVQALGDRRAVLLRNHGLCGVGGNPGEALEVCTLVERVARVYFYAAMVGQPRTLPEDAIAAEQAIYRMRTGLDT